MTTLLDKHCPFVKKSYKPRPNSPWFDDDLRKTKRELRAAERKYKGAKTKENHILMKIKKNLDTTGRANIRDLNTIRGLLRIVVKMPIRCLS